MSRAGRFVLKSVEADPNHERASKWLIEPGTKQLLDSHPPHTRANMRLMQIWDNIHNQIHL